MRDVLGSSIGQANLVAARADGTTVTRRSVLTLYPHRPAEVGVPAENPNLGESGLIFRQFIAASGETPRMAPSGALRD
jgi:hypothetical protein